MMLEPDEREDDVEVERERLAALLAQPNSIVLLATLDDHEIAGYLEAEGGRFRRNRHVAQIVVGVRQPATGQRLGTWLFEELIAWASSADMHRLELTVMTHNQAAIKLYCKLGFVIEGTRQASMRIDGRWVDEYAMVRLLG